MRFVSISIIVFCSIIISCQKTTKVIDKNSGNQQDSDQLAMDREFDDVSEVDDQYEIDVPATDADNITQLCGNNIVEPGEICDSQTMQCADLHSSYTSGEAVCKNDCSGFDVSSCQSSGSDPVCGNKKTETGEVCDGNSVDCTTLGSYVSGTAICLEDCSAYDKSLCISEDCNTIDQSCITDSECCQTAICVNGVCVEGCSSDDDCAPFAMTKCNRKLGRCLNVAASNEACSEKNCTTGCCYGEDGLTAVKCLPQAELSSCGICSQGEIFMGKRVCVPAACSITNDRCNDYNKRKEFPDCYECSPTDEYICRENRTPQCTSNSSGKLINVNTCIPSGSLCIQEASVCCSGQPCIQGYCY